MPWTQDGLPWAPRSETSHDAAIQARAFIGQQGLEVLAYIASRGSDGCTQKEASAALGIGRPSIAARFHALEQAGKLVKTARRKDGCAIYVSR